MERMSFPTFKQAPRAWFSKFHKTITQLNFSSSAHDSALFTRKTDNDTVVLLLYVDDMIITGDDSIGIEELKKFLCQHFEMKDLGPLTYFMGLEVLSSSGVLFLSHANQFMASPHSTHYAAVLQIIRYIKGALYYGLHYSATSSLILNAYSDVDWAGDPSDCRSTTGFCIFLGDSLISWRSKKQTLTARSSTESEYRALAGTTSEILWLRWLLADLETS
ncbi:unnamed protein product [Trifolium pratense]|uniref:Uncharacterized protein n=1 Tax=Trifolium pratense TaxID=57577 RepID=A0ACB0JD24_TRIPR|nr:unnamed protein product [Trifolium pratense]